MDRPSLEALIESEDLGLEILHPGGLGMTRELAALMGIASGTAVLEVAAGTGETARLLARELGARVTTVDNSPRMIGRQRRKLLPHGLAVSPVWADAVSLPFPADSFDVVISECAVCSLEKASALREMARVARPGGRIGIHDLCWKEGASASIRRRLLEIERESPETLRDWVRVFEGAGLREVRAYDRSHLMASWTREVKRELGLEGYFVVLLRVLKRWGLGGLRTVLESERIFASPCLGYALVLGAKPAAASAG